MVHPVTLIVWVALGVGAVYWRASHRDDDDWDLPSAIGAMYSAMLVMVSLVFLMAFLSAPDFFFRVLTKVFGD